MSSKPEVTPGRPGSARVEYFACREDVEAMIAKGYNAMMIYEHMKKQGRVTCSYSAFCDYVRGGGKRLHSKGGKKPKPALQTTPRQPQENRVKPFTPEPRENRAFDISSVDLSTLI